MPLEHGCRSRSHSLEDSQGIDNTAPKFAERSFVSVRNINGP